MSWREIRAILIGAPLVLAVWFAGVALITLFQPAGVPVVVLARGGATAALDVVIAAGGSILQVRNETVIAIADDPRFVGRLYQHGALMVVQATAGGCISRRQAGAPSPPQSDGAFFASFAGGQT
jgi:hypothetical protein